MKIIAEAVGYEDRTAARKRFENMGKNGKLSENPQPDSLQLYIAAYLKVH